jgi:hypothetical protein
MTLRYRRKQTEVDAILWTGYNKEAMMRFLGDDRDGTVQPSKGLALKVNLNTVRHPLWAELPAGAYLVRDTRGLFGIQTRESFEEEYERIAS